jgi:hypothetical protein
VHLSGVMPLYGDLLSTANTSLSDSGLSNYICVFGSFSVILVHERCKCMKIPKAVCFETLSQVD